MKIGLDFDGVISDCGQLKSKNAKILYGVKIPSREFKKELVIGKGILTLRQYESLQHQIYNTREIGLKMLPVKGALEIIPRLQQEGHNLEVITSRNPIGSKIAKEWMVLNNLKLNIISVGGNNKSDACKNLDIYIDDDLDKLEPLVNIVPYRYLFSWDYNKNIQVPENIAKRINSWNHFYNEISKLNSASKHR